MCLEGSQRRRFYIVVADMVVANLGFEIRSNNKMPNIIMHNKIGNSRSIIVPNVRSYGLAKAEDVLGDIRTYGYHTRATRPTTDNKHDK